MKRKRQGRISRASLEVPPIIRQFGRRASGVHTEIWARWAELVGDWLSERAFPHYYHLGTLTIAVKNSCWMQEVSFLTQVLIDRFAEEVGLGVVKKIRFVIDTSLPSLSNRQPSCAPPAPAQSLLPSSIQAAVDSVVREDLKDAVSRAARASLARLPQN